MNGFIQDKPAYNPEYLLLIVAPICLTAIIIIYVSISKEINKLIVSAPPRQQVATPTLHLPLHVYSVYIDTRAFHLSMARLSIPQSQIICNISC